MQQQTTLTWFVETASGLTVADWANIGLAAAMLLVTIALAFIAGFQNRLHRRQQDHFCRTERAYVRLSAVDGQLVVTSDGVAKLRLTLKNHGNTPAYVSDVQAGLTPLTATAPPLVVECSAAKTFYGLLMPGEELPLALDKELGAATADIKNDLGKMWLLGFVDYRDAFGRRYRGGYCRRVGPFTSSESMPLDGHTHTTFLLMGDYQPHLDDDRERAPGEGHDW